MPNIQLEDTIAALATPPGEGGLAIIRVSGPEAFRLAGRTFVPRRGKMEEFASHTVHLGEIRSQDGQMIEQALVTVFRAPNSYTGQDVLEISCHGGLVITRRILDDLIQAGARHAEPGEFTKRAFLNGRMDLTQAEAVLDLIKARSDKALEAAARQLAGSLSRKFKSLRDSLMHLLAHMEACLDFPDENLDVYADTELLNKLAAIRAEMAALLGSFRRGALLREGVSLVLVGRPNVGKSSLFNALLERDRALVSEHAGTTRDVLEEALEIQGVYVRLADTAGLGHETDHPVDRLGIERTREILPQGDIFLYIVDGSAPLSPADNAVLAEIPAGKPRGMVINKSDLPQAFSAADLEKFSGLKDAVKLSARSGAGLEMLEKQIYACMDAAGTGEGEQITRLRHKNALEKSLAAIQNAESALMERRSLEYVTLDIKNALDELRELIGEIYSEDLLDVIFAEFCIGK